jgi:hypothetical protein
MANSTEMTDDRRGMPWRPMGWGAAGCLLLLPLIAHAPWTLSDFIVAAALLGGAGLALELAVRASGDAAYRAGAGAAVAAAFLLIWVNGAVGFLGDEDNPANLMFFGVLAIAALGSVLARFHAGGMARAMLVTAAAQILVGAIALAAGLGSPGAAGIYEAVMGTSVFAALWLLSAGLFHRAAGRAAA